MIKKRSIVTQPQNGGRACPLLEASVSCNEDECPQDCQLGDWGGWSACSADCGGGVIERTRPVTVEPENGGNPCDETEDTLACNIQSCDVDCVLSDWSEWTGCSKACGGGSQKRTRAISTEAHGSGRCWEPTEGERLAFKSCNTLLCTALLPEGRETLHCSSKVDVVV